MDRPIGVTVTTITMSIFNLFGLFVVKYTKLPSGQEGARAFVAVVVLILIALGYLVLWFFWRGHNWARWLVMLTSIVALWNIRDLAKPDEPYLLAFMIIGEVAIAIYLLWYLNTADVKSWFKRS